MCKILDFISLTSYMGMFGPYGKYIVLWDRAHVSMEDPTM